MKCQNINCGKIIDDDSKFCIYCGAEQNLSLNTDTNAHSSKEIEQTPKKHCCNSDCNELIDFDSTFCDFCGAKQPVRNYKKGNLEPFNEGEKWGFKDKVSRDIIIPPIYQYVGKFINSRAVVQKLNKYSYIDKNGNELTTFKYEDATDFINNYAKVKRDNKWAFINKECEQITQFKYDKAENFENGIALVELEGKTSLINEKGEEIIPFQFEEIVQYSGNLFKVQQANNFRLIDRNGNEVLPGIYFGLIDRNGNEVLPCIYHYLGDISEGIAKISTGVHYGFINEKGEIIISCKYEEVYFIDNDVIAVKEKGTWKCFDSLGSDISESNQKFLSFLERKKKKKATSRLIIIFLIVLSVLSIFIIYDYNTNDIGLVRMVQTWVLGKDEMDWRDAIENGSVYKVSPLENYLKKHPEGKYVEEAKAKIEELVWDKTIAENSIESYEFYIKKYPEGKMNASAREIIQWEKAEESSTLKAYKDYLAIYPDGKYKEAVNNNIEELIWIKTTAQDRKYGYEKYLKDYPNGVFARDARTLILKMEAEEKEQKAWNVANSVNSIQSYIDYLTQYPSGKYSESALYKLEAKTVCESCNGTGKCSKCNGTGKYGRKRKLFYDRCPRASRLFHGKNCKICGGDGKINERYEWVDADCPDCYNGKCSKCNGTGNIQIKWLTEWYANKEGMTLCSSCNGTGKCYKCNGSGKGREQKKLVWDPCPVKTNSHYGCGYCGGDGKINVRYEYYYERCDVCKGSGKCKYCNGEGLIPLKK